MHLRSRLPPLAPLAWAGVQIAIFAGFLWIVTLVNFFSVTGMLLRTAVLPHHP